MCFHATINTDKQEVEVEPDSKAISNSQFLVEIFPPEQPARLFYIIFYGPNISGIHKPGQLYQLIHFTAVLQAEVDLYITNLASKIVTQRIPL